MLSYTQRRHGVFHKKRRLTKRFKHTIRKSQRRVMRGGMKGTKIYEDGRQYDGDMKDGEANGRGKMTWPDGTVYEGDIKDGKENGYGITKWTDGAVYVGNFKNGLWHGKGKMRWANREVYEGSFMNGLRHGKGKTTYPNGEFYEGDYIHGLKHGIGRYQWADGSVYVGEWIDDNMNGRGKWRDENGVVYEGNIREGGINSLSLLLQDSNVTNIAFHPSEPLLLAVCRGKTHKDPETLFLQRFNRKTGHIIDRILIPPSDDFAIVKSIAFHPTEPIFAVGNVKEEVDLFSWEINDGSVDGLSFHKILSITQIPCEKIVFHPREPLFATYGKNGNEHNTRIWRIERATADNAESLFELTDREIKTRTALSCIAFHPTQPIIITSSDTTTLVDRSDKRNENCVILWKYHTSPSEPIVILSNLEAFASNSKHNSYHRDDVNFVAFHPTEPLFATASKDATIKMWRMMPQRNNSLYAYCVATFLSDNKVSPVTCLAFHPTESLLVGGLYNGNAVVWEYMGVLSTNVLSLEPDMYTSKVVTVFSLPPPMPHRMRMTPAMLTEAKGKLHRRSDREHSVAMMNSPRVPSSTTGVEEDSERSPSPPPKKILSRTELERFEQRKREETQRARETQGVLEANSRIFVSAVNFQVDSRGVSFLEIGRNNTDVVELRNVSDLMMSEFIIKNRDQIELLKLRKKLVHKTSRDFMASQPLPRPGTFRFTGSEIASGILREPIRLRSIGVTALRDREWDEMRRKGEKPRPNLEQSDKEKSEAIELEIQEENKKRDEENKVWLTKLEKAKAALDEQKKSSEGGNSRRTRRKNRRKY